MLGAALALVANALAVIVVAIMLLAHHALDLIESHPLVVDLGKAFAAEHLDDPMRQMGNTAFAEFH